MESIYRCHNLRSLIFLFCCVFLITLTFAEEPVAESSHRFKFSWSSVSNIELNGKKTQSQSDTNLIICRHTKGNEVAISIEDMLVRSITNGKGTFESRVNKSGFYLRVNEGALQKLPDEQLGPLEKELLAAGIGKPFLWLKVDENGKELSRKIADNEAAKLFMANGMDTNCTLFHTRLDPDSKSWKCPIIYSMSGGGKGEGEFTYTLNAQSKAATTVVSIAGQLKAAEVEVGDPKLSAKNFLFDGKGQQVFDLKLKTWISGTLKGPMSADFYKNGALAFSTKGTLEFNMELIKPAAKSDEPKEEK